MIQVISMMRAQLYLPKFTTTNRAVYSHIHLLVLDNVISAGVASSAVSGEDLSTVLKISGECGRGDGHHADDDGGGDLLSQN